MHQYPVNLVLDGRRCLVVGGGTIALRKVQGLVACGGQVRVVAPRIDPDLRKMDEVEFDERPWQPEDLDGVWLVIAATDDATVNRAVYDAGQRAGVWVNGADDPANCSFTLPSVVRRGDLQIAVSTAGRSPALARWLRGRFESEIGPEYATLLDILATEREGLKAAGRSTEGLDWQSALDSDMLGLIRNGDLVHARERLLTCLSSSSD